MSKDNNISPNTKEYSPAIYEIEDDKTATESSDEILYKSSIHDYNKPHSAPEIVLSVNNEIWGTRGNFSVISGSAKSKKSFLVAGLLPSFLTDKIILETFKGHSIEKRPEILYFDTEQSPYHLQQKLESSFKLGKLKKNEITGKLKVFILRPKTVEERIRTIEYAINKSGENVNLVIIDGIRDLMYDINNSAEASEIVLLLLKWTYEYGFHIITVIHNNKVNNKIRGHIGTELLNKCETHIDISEHAKYPSISNVTFKDSRNKLPRPFSFKITSDGTIEKTDPYTVSSGKSKLSPESIRKEKYLIAINTAFDSKDELNSGELSSVLSKQFKVGKSKAKQYIKYCTEELQLLIKKKGINNADIYSKV